MHHEFFDRYQWFPHIFHKINSLDEVVKEENMLFEIQVIYSLYKASPMFVRVCLSSCSPWGPSHANN